MVANSHPPPRRKFSVNDWRFDYHPSRKRWETYRNPGDWPADLFKWLHQSFGHPAGNDKWDYHGGWIYFYEEKCVTMFMLRWS